MNEDMNEETGRSIPTGSDYEGGLPHDDGILSESLNAQDADFLPGETPDVPAQPKPRKKPRQPDEGSDSAADAEVRNSTVKQKKKRPAAEDASSPGAAPKKRPAAERSADGQPKKRPAAERDADGQPKKRPAADGGTGSQPKKRPAADRDADGQPKKRPAAKAKPENRGTRPVPEKTGESRDRQIQSLKKKTNAGRKQLPATTNGPDTTEVALIPKPADRETALIRSTGLTAEEVQYRVQQGEVNVTVPKGQKSVGRIIASHTLTYFNLLNFALAILVLITGQIKNVLFLGTCISNTLIGIIQELKVKSLIDKLSVITTTGRGEY